MAKNGVVGVESTEVVVVGTVGLGLDTAAAAAAACKLAMLLCKNSGTPEKARRLEASLSAAN